MRWALTALVLSAGITSVAGCGSSEADHIYLRCMNIRQDGTFVAPAAIVTIKPDDRKITYEPYAPISKLADTYDLVQIDTTTIRGAKGEARDMERSEIVIDRIAGRLIARKQKDGRWLGSEYDCKPTKPVL
jgi:hypothetical protein